MEYIIIGCVAILGAVLIFHKKKSEDEGDSVKKSTSSLDGISLPKVDSREQKIENSAGKLREILLTLTDVMSNVDVATDSSSLVLGEAKVKISNLKSAQYGDEAAVLLDEIDKVISSNNSLRDELSRSRAEITSQQEKINNLQTAVRIDSLTEIANRAALKEQMNVSFENLNRHNDTFSLLMIDIDYFKKINDTYGHVVGDRILKGLSLKLKTNTRVGDFVARYGGEEFAIIVVKAGVEQAKKIAEKLRISVESSKFVIDNQRLAITISLGVAEAIENDGMDDLVKRADKALYVAKKNGRNRVEVYSESECLN